MKFYFCKGKKITEEDYAKLSPEDQKGCRPWKGTKSQKKSSGKPEYKKQDAAWYVVSPNITRAVANIPFNVFSGVKQAITYNNGTNAGLNIVASVDVPAVMVTNCILTYGDSHEGTSAINVASKALYSYVRHFNSGRANYDSPDLMIYIMAMSQIYAAISDAMRAYELAMTYRYENKYIPKGIAQALMYDIADISSNLANFRAQINLIVAKVSAMCIPTGFNIHKRHAFIMRNIFTDSDSLRGQFYVFRADRWLQWSATASTKGTSLVTYNRSISNITLGQTADEIISDLNALIDPIIYDEDANIMSGDILKAFGAGNVYTLNELDEKSVASFVFNEDLLQQIENSHAVNYTSSGQYSITQDGNTNIVTDEGFASTLFDVTTQFFNSHKKEDATPDDVLEWSRMTNMWVQTSNRSFTLSYGTELITGYQYIVGYPMDGGLRLSAKTVLGIAADGNDNVRQILAVAECFDWHPIHYVFEQSGTTSSQYNYRYFSGDLKIAALITGTTVKQLNDAAVMGALNSLQYLKSATNNQK